MEAIVGREAELRAVDAALAALARGRPAALEVEGEPGIGKTRLLAELGRRADDHGQLVLTGSASELERELPFWVFVDALDEYVRGLPPVVLDALPRDELARVLPPAGGVPRALSMPHERHRAHQAVRELLGVLAARQPLVAGGRLGAVRERWEHAAEVAEQLLVERVPAARLERLEVLVERVHEHPERQLALELGRAAREHEVALAVGS